MKLKYIKTSIEEIKMKKEIKRPRTKDQNIQTINKENLYAYLALGERKGGETIDH